MATRSRRVKPGEKNSLFREQLEVAIESCKIGIDQKGFKEQFINDFIGRGIFTERQFKKGDYLLEYQGELLGGNEARRREQKYEKEGRGCFMYFFKYKEKVLCIDATTEQLCSKGRIVNDAAPGDPKLNAEMKIIAVTNCPHLCLFAKRDIADGEELRFDYGVGDLPWRKHMTEASKGMEGMESSYSENKCQRKPESNTSLIASAKAGCSTEKGEKNRPQQDGNIEEIQAEDVEAEEIHKDFDQDKTYNPNETDNEGSTVDLSDTDSEVIQVVPDIKVHDKGKTYDNEDFQKKNLQSGASIMSSKSGKLEKSKLQEKSKIIVPKTSNKSVRVYDKKFFCLYCQTAQSKLKTHLLRRHTDEEEMDDYSKETNLSEKAKKYEKIRNLGNHLHNLEVLKTCKGELSVSYRKRHSDDSETDANGYGPCQYCFAWHVKHDLWRHLKSCKFVPKDKCVKKGRIQAASNMLLPDNQELGPNFNEILAFMKNDDIRRIVKSDDLILMYGKKMSSKYGHERDQFNYVRQNLRVLARFLKEIRLNTKCPTKPLIEFMSPVHFNTIIDTVKKQAIYDETKNRYGIPSLAIKTGQALKKCVKLAIRLGIQNKNKELVEDAANLRTLFDQEWEDEVTSNAHKTLYEGKRNSKKGLLPLADDVKVLTNYLIEENKRMCEMMQTSKSIEETRETWIRLSEILLAQTIIFNRRRAGEVSKMTLEDYQKTTLERSECMEESLSDFEKNLCKTIQRTEIAGKRGRTVAVLFPSIVKLGIDKLIETRSKVSSMENEYLFPVLSSTSHLRGTDCLRKLSELCGAKEPERLRSTKLRKQIATLSQIMNLQDNELDILAQFLGHDIRVGTVAYRLRRWTSNRRVLSSNPRQTIGIFLSKKIHPTLLHSTKV